MAIVYLLYSIIVCGVKSNESLKFKLQQSPLLYTEIKGYRLYCTQKSKVIN